MRENNMCKCEYGDSVCQLGTHFSYLSRILSIYNVYSIHCDEYVPSGQSTRHSPFSTRPVLVPMRSIEECEATR